MAEGDQQGTGKHPHKSTEEPHPHHEGKSEGASRSVSQGSHSGHETRGSSASRSRSEDEPSSSQGSESSDLKSREYRDKEGNIHHHTHTAETTHEEGKGAGR